MTVSSASAGPSQPTIDVANTTVVVLAGGVGAARLLRGMVLAVEPTNVTALINVADDVVLHGLNISPDLDTVTYTLAGQDNTETGWGLTGETWQAMDMVKRYGGLDWFNLGDRDLGTHLYRTHRLNMGATLSEVTAEIAAGWDIGANLLPITNDRIETRVTVEGEGEIGFQEYFVRLRHNVPVSSVRFVGAGDATPAPGVLDAIASADVVVIAPSNPIVSIGPLLAIEGIEDAIKARRAHTVAISPIIAGKALKGPADRLMAELGLEASVEGIADVYAPLAATLIVDTADQHRVNAVQERGMHCVATDTIMKTADVAAQLTRTIITTVKGNEHA